MIPAVGRKALGYLEEVGEGGVVRQADTFTCQHCNRIGLVQPFKSAEESGSGAMCYGCGGLICLGCLKRSRQNDVPKCDHIERKLERQVFRILPLLYLGVVLNQLNFLTL